MIEPLRRAPRLHYRLCWFAIGVGMILLLLYGSLAPAKALPPMGDSDKFWHGAAYFAVMAYFSQLCAGVRARALLAAGLVAMGVAVEFIQPYVNRQFDWFDALANTSGVFVAFGLSFPPFDRIVASVDAILQRRLSGR